MPEKAQKRALQPAQTMLGRIHQSNFASSHCQLTLPDRQSCKTIEFAPRRHEHTWPHGVHHAGARAAVALGARPSRTWSVATRPPRSSRPRPAPAWRPTARARAHFLITSWRCAWHCPTRLLPPDSRASVERAMTLRATSPSRGLMRSLRTPGSRRPRPPPATGPRDRSHRPAAAVRRVHCCHCATDCAGATRLRGLGAAAVAGPLTLRRPLLRAAWGVRGGARGAQRPPWHVFSARSSLEAMRPCGAWQLACSALDAEKSLYIREVQQAVLL